MPVKLLVSFAFACAFAILPSLPVMAEALVPVPRSRPGSLTLVGALQRAAATNPRLTAADRDIGIAGGRHLQAGAIPNPDLSFELDNAIGTGEYRGL